MIGVLCPETERATAAEFFELFKTPWEFYRVGSDYEVVLSTGPDLPDFDGSFLMVFSTSPTGFDERLGIGIAESSVRFLNDQYGNQLPVYGKVVCLQGSGRVVITGAPGESIAMELSISSRGIMLRVGYDLFKEVFHLLTVGQPPRYAAIPALDIHISQLRTWIVAAGVPLVEIPPVPYGFSFFGCLTHDVDFAGIRRHSFDHTLLGFIYRGLAGSLIRAVRGRIGFSGLIQNWTAVLKLPLVYLGLADDFWEHFDDYAEADDGCRSTFFLIPFKHRAGDRLEGTGQQRIWSRRAAPYDIGDVQKQVKRLTDMGFEIGLHGIDAWHDLKKAVDERDQIRAHTDLEGIGIRMHWLCYDRQTPNVLEEAGFDYDATLGYNETVGFRNGTVQLFKPVGLQRLLEVPLNIQDTSLFYPKRMNSSESEAKRLCAGLMAAACQFGGVITLSWHERSLVPERLWGGFYQWLLQRLKANGAFLGNAREIAAWFRSRRSISFRTAQLLDNKFEVEFAAGYLPSKLGITLRCHMPAEAEARYSISEHVQYIDVPWNGEDRIKIPLTGEVN